MKLWPELNEDVAAIIESLRTEPERWASDEHYLYIDEVDDELSLCGFPRRWFSPIQIWIANGVSFLRVDRNHAKWNSYSRRKLWKAYKKWKSLPRTGPAHSPIISALSVGRTSPDEQNGKIIHFPKGPASRS